MEKRGDPDIFSHASIIGKWQKFAELTICFSHIVQLTTRSTLDVYDSHFPLARYVSR